MRIPLRARAAGFLLRLAIDLALQIVCNNTNAPSAKEAVMKTFTYEVVLADGTVVKHAGIESVDTSKDSAYTFYDADGVVAMYSPGEVKRCTRVSA